MTLAEDLLKQVLNEQQKHGVMLAEITQKLDGHIHSRVAIDARLGAVEKSVEKFEDLRRLVKLSYKIIAAVVVLLAGERGMSLWFHFH